MAKFPSYNFKFKTADISVSSNRVPFNEEEITSTTFSDDSVYVMTKNGEIWKFQNNEWSVGGYF